MNMIRELSWDSTFFGRKMGELTLSTTDPDEIQRVIDTARGNGYQYLICKLLTFQMRETAILESLGFYLSDICVTWEIGTNAFIVQKQGRRKPSHWSVREAGIEDIPDLQKMSEGLFLASRFYSDPFFTEKEADDLFRTWIGNAVTGNAADAVFIVPGCGFITCKLSVQEDETKGRISLIGIAEHARRKGVGSALIEHAAQWFSRREATTIYVRTQLKNLESINFYSRFGFSLQSYDMLFSKIF